jgi:amino acid transporter
MHPYSIPQVAIWISSILTILAVLFGTFTPWMVFIHSQETSSGWLVFFLIANLATFLASTLMTAYYNHLNTKCVATDSLVTKQRCIKHLKLEEF